ncbi:hypothetical protein [Geodermatophilus sp. SYSU D01119]
MSRWATRALRVTLLTGGLLAVGTGVAAASDQPGDVDLDVVVPVTVTDNALGVLGDAPAATGLELPAVSQDLSLDLGPVAVSVPVALGGNDAAVGSGGVSQPPAGPAPADDPADVAVPVTVVGNGIGVLGDAEASGAAPAAPEGAVTVPVTVCGNGVGLLGDAAGQCALPGGGTPGTGTPGTGTPGTGTPGTGDGGIDVDVPVTVCGVGLGLLGSGTGDCTPPAGPGGPTDPTGPQDPGTPQHPAPEQPGPQHPGPQHPGPQHPGLVTPVAGAGTWTSAGDGTGVLAGTGSGSTTGSGTVAGSGSSGGGRLAYTGSDVTGVLGAALLVLLAGAGLSLTARRRSGTA